MIIPEEEKNRFRSLNALFNINNR